MVVFVWYGWWCFGGFCVDGGGFFVVVVAEQWWRFFPSSQFGFCVDGDWLCLSLIMVAGAWLGLTFSKNRFFTSKTKH